VRERAAVCQCEEIASARPECLRVRDGETLPAIPILDEPRTVSVVEKPEISLVCVSPFLRVLYRELELGPR